MLYPTILLSLAVFFCLFGQDAFLTLKSLKAEPASETSQEETISKGDIIFKVEAEKPRKEKAPPSTTPVIEKKTSPPVEPATEKKPSTPAQQSASEEKITPPVQQAAIEKKSSPPAQQPVSEKKTSLPAEQSASETKALPGAEKPAGEKKTPTVTESPPKEKQDPLIKPPVQENPKGQEPLQPPPPGLAGQSKVQDTVNVSQDSLQELLQQAYECMEKDKKYEARSFYSRALLLETSAERRQLLKKHLDELNQALVFSPGTGPDSIIYTVKPGDTLVKIAKANNTTPELIMRLNRKGSTKILPQEPLKILHGKVSLLVDKSDFTLTLLLDGNYIKQYLIGTGKNDKTPEGKFIIENRIKDPVWYAPEGVYPFGHPQNILGTRWLGFQDSPGLIGYGIHGTTEPESVGSESSNGCIRMLNKDVEELFDFVTEGTEVVIKK